MSTNLKKHLELLGENTSGGSHDAVMFSGKGLELLKSLPGMKNLFKNSKKAEEEDDEDEDDEKESFQKSGDNTRYPQSRRNGGDLEEEDEDPDDAADTNEEENEANGDRGSIISNKGKRTKKSSLKSAVSKNDYRHDERNFQKGFEDHEEVLDASPALKQLVAEVNAMGKRFAKSQAGTSEATHEALEVVMQQNAVLGRVVGELLKSQAALAGEIELIKKTPVGQPHPGVLSYEMKKNDGSTGRKLRKSDIEDAINDAMDQGFADPNLLTQLAYVRNDADLRQFVEDLPDDIRKTIN